MSIPSLRELALSLCSLHDECADIDGETICVKKRGHEGEHKYVSMRRVIPFS